MGISGYIFIIMVALLNMITLGAIISSTEKADGKETYKTIKLLLSCLYENKNIFGYICATLLVVAVIPSILFMMIYVLIDVGIRFIFRLGVKKKY